MYKNQNNSRQLISEMRLMLATKPTRRGLLEGLVYGEDGEEMMGGTPEQEMGGAPEQEMNQQMPQGGQQMQQGSEEVNPLDEDPEIAQLITGIRVQTLQGLTKLAENPESAQYELLKKIFLLVDKAVEDKVNPEK